MGLGSAWVAMAARMDAMTIDGEWIGEGGRAAVTVTGLGAAGCDLAPIAGGILKDGEFTLWIGAIGPFRGFATRHDTGHLAARFSEPLDARIIHHFEMV